MASKSVQARVIAARKSFTASTKRAVAGTINPKVASANAKDLMVAKKLGKDGSVVASKKS